MAAPQIIHDLVERFDRNVEAYRAGQYNETQVRREFIDPFFKALGWDIDNQQGHAEAYKDVIHEDAIKIGSATKAPDYCFRIGGTRKFFLEAKKPSIDIKGDPGPAYQLRRYAWSAKLPLSVLTDFEELAVYDCRIRPNATDKPSVARIQYVRYTDYIEQWDSIAAIFSKEAVLKGSFDKYADTARLKKGTTQVDDAFLLEIETWRDELARTIALRNGSLTNRQLNFAVQATIDRIIFLRICEDRGIERYGQLLGLLNGDKVYERLLGLFRKADDRYNSGLFHFSVEKDRPDAPDELTPGLTIDDKVLKDLLRRLYYPESPYEFSVLSAEILGQVYEQFLGKVITLTAGHRAKVEDKPEVKKAGGVFYTPAYIVDYIVQNTVGKLLQGKTPKEVEKLKILDPACGSGSFLLGAYQFLLDWHLRYYIDNDPAAWAKGKNPPVCQTAGTGTIEALNSKHEIRNKFKIGNVENLKQEGQDCRLRGNDTKGGGYRLTLEERKRILLNNIFGVDIDSQAVEVTKLSLLLKVLEGQKDLSLFARQRALPDLGDNIKCGNSLIGPDFYQQQQMMLFDEDEKYKINAFDWQTEFKPIFSRKNPGFDAVIGNPPWLMAGYYVQNSLDYLKRKYKVAVGKFDLYYVFVERSMSLLSINGFWGMIIPNKYFHTESACSLREILFESKYVYSIIDFGDEKIFSNATNYSCIMLLQKKQNDHLLFARSKAGLLFYESFSVESSFLSHRKWNFENKEFLDLFCKIESTSIQLELLVERFGTGVQTGSDTILVLDKEKSKELNLEIAAIRPIIKGRDVRRYCYLSTPKSLIFPYTICKDKFQIFTEKELEQNPYVKKYLSLHKEKLSHRIWFGKSAQELSGKWYGLMYLDSPSSFSKPHILTPSLSNHSNFILGNSSLFVTGTAGVTSIIPKTDTQENILYLLGLLNSKLISLYIIKHSPIFSGGYYKFSAPYLKKTPIRAVDFSNKKDKALHDKMVSLVETMLELHKRVSAAKTPVEKTALGRQIDATDGQIDRLVYELYGLTDEEIAIVEDSGK